MKKLPILILSLLAAPAHAAPSDIGEIADRLQGQAGQVTDLLTVASFVIGVVMAVAGLMKFHANSRNPNDPSNKISTAFVLIFVGSGLVALPATLGSGISTIFGEGAARTDANVGFRDL